MTYRDLQQHTPEGQAAAWAVAVFAARERPEQLVHTLQAIQAAALPGTVVDVLCNGSTALTGDLACQLARMEGQWTRIVPRVWYLPVADKASAWNHYVQHIWPEGRLAIFLDGHCRPVAGSLAALADGLARAPQALAASAVPSVGRTAARRRAQMLEHGGMVGELLAIRHTVMHRLRQRQIRLPLGLYGFDGMLGAFFAFNLDPAHHDWQLKDRVAVCLDSTWHTDPKRWWLPSHVQAQIRRHQRIALRKMVGKATQEHLAQRRQLPEQLPRTAAELVLQWQARQPQVARQMLLTNPLCALALARLLRPVDWRAADTPPLRLWHRDSSPLPWQPTGGMPQPLPPMPGAMAVSVASTGAWQ